MIGDLGKDLLQGGGVAGLDLDQGVAWIAPGLADADLLDAEGAARRGDAVEDFGQDQAVDDVAADLDILDVDGRRSGRRCAGLGTQHDDGSPESD